MAKNIFFVNALLQNERKSISALSSQLIELLNSLGQIDSIFYSFIYSNEGFDDAEFNIKALGVEKAKAKLEKLILQSNMADIKQYEGESSPTLEFSRDFGFSHLLKFPIEGQVRFSATGNLATTTYPYFRLEHFYSDQTYSFNWYNKVLKCLVDNLNPIYAGIIIRLPTFFNPYSELRVKHPFGWITYFAKDYELQIPDDLVGVEYEHSEKGKYIILTREDFTTGKEAYEAQRDRLLGIMKEVKERVPEYSE